MMTYGFASASEIDQVAKNLREADQIEMQKIHGEDADLVEIIRKGAELTRPTQVLRHHRRPIALYGCKHLENGVGVIWLLGTKKIEQVSMSFLRASKPVLDGISKKSDVVFNFVWSGNHVHLRWLRWLGFEVAPHIEGLPEAPREFLVAAYTPPKNV